jgi:hypothetical protein
METTFTIGIGALGLLIGAGISAGITRGKLGEVERLVKALFKKFDDLAKRQIQAETDIARHDERIDAIKSEVRDLRSRTGVTSVSTVSQMPTKE